MRSVNKPAVVHARDWTTDRLLFSVVVYPPLDELDMNKAEQAHFERIKQIKEIVARGAGIMRFSLYLETQWDVEWDYEREVWVDPDDHAYDASRFGVGTRSESGRPGRNGDD